MNKQRGSETEAPSRKAVWIGIKSGIIASSCCIIPLILILTFVFAGVGSVAAAFSFTQYRPYFVALGAVFLLASMYLYLNRKYGRCDLYVIMRNRRFIFMTIAVFITVFSTTFYLFLPILSESVYSSLPASATSAQMRDTRYVGLREVTLKVGGMTCSGCAYGIEYALRQKVGVVEAKINYPEGTGIVVYDPAKTTGREIAQTVTELGFSAEIVGDKIR